MSVLINLRGSSKSMAKSCFFSAKSACLDVSKIDRLEGRRKHPSDRATHLSAESVRRKERTQQSVKHMHSCSRCARGVLGSSARLHVDFHGTSLSPVITEQVPRVLPQVAGGLSGLILPSPK